VSYRQTSLLLRGLSDGTFQDMRNSAGQVFTSAILVAGSPQLTSTMNGDLDLAFTRLKWTTCASAK